MVSKMALSSLIQPGSRLENAVSNFKGKKQAAKENSVSSNKKHIEKKAKANEPGKNNFNCVKYSNWLVPSHRYDRWQAEEAKRLEEEKFKPNVKVRFLREHRVKCMHEDGSESLVCVPEGWECVGCYSKKGVKVKSVEGILSFRKTDVEVLEWHE